MVGTRAAWALAVVVLALALPLGELLLDEPAGAATRVLPTRIGSVTIVWARVVPSGSDMRCYIARKPTPGNRGLWVCG